MKRFFLFGLLALCISTAYGQRTTYFTEDFSVATGGTHQWNTYWDTDSSAKMLKYIYILNNNLSGGEAPEAIIGYYPDAGLSDILNSTYRLVSKPFTTQAGAPCVTVKYAYRASKKSLKNNRHLGLWAQKGSGKWIECAIVENLPTQIDNGVLSAKLPAEFANADSVRVALQVKSSKDNVQFYFTLDDVSFFSLSSDYYSAKVDVLTLPNVSGKLDTLDLKLCNLGNEIKNNYTISYSWDGGQVNTETLNTKLDTANKPIPICVDELAFVRMANKGWNETTYGTRVLEIWVSAVDGKNIAESALQRKTFRFSNVKESDLFTKKVLVEEFTSATCGPCASFNSQVLNPTFEKLGLDIVLIKYQMNWPGNGDKYYTEEGGVRRSYYGVNAVPAMAVNGKVIEIPGSETRFMSYLRNQMDTDNKSFFNIVFDTVKMDSVLGMLRLVYSVHTKGVLPAATLQTVVLEDVTTQNVGSNGEKEFHHVMMKMMPGANGVAVNYKADTVYTYAYTVDMTKTHMEQPDDLLVACFIQAPDGSIVQAAIQREREKGGTTPNTANETVLESETLAFFPNPASEEVYLKGLENASVEVCDLTGRRQYFSTGIKGDHTLDVRGYRPGLYIIKVNEGNRVSVGRLNVVR